MIRCRGFDFGGTESGPDHECPLPATYYFEVPGSLHQSEATPYCARHLERARAVAAKYYPGSMALTSPIRGTAE